MDSATRAPSAFRAMAQASLWVAVCLANLECTSAPANGSACVPPDQDGVAGGSVPLDLTVTDTAFAPLILKAENLATVTLTLTNAGTTPHSFAVDCIPSPNLNGCPTTSCFPDGGGLGPLAPDATATATFVTPNVEGIYTFRSTVAGDSDGDAGLTGQFIVQ